MKTYLLTSTAFTGEVVFTFNEENILLKYDTTGATLSKEQLEWITLKLPKTLSQLQAVLKASKGSKLTEQKWAGVTFEQFWPMAYVNKGSSKKVSLKVWERLPQAERDKAANYWPTYMALKAHGEGVKYVETYLRSEVWNN